MNTQQVMRRLSLLAVVPLAAACATTSGGMTDRELRPAADTPASFVTEDGVETTGNECLNPLIDPRDQTRIRLVRSGRSGGQQVGDYEVPDRKYGVGDNELLRILCTSGQAMGVVRN